MARFVTILSPFCGTGILVVCCELRSSFFSVISLTKNFYNGPFCHHFVTVLSPLSPFCRRFVTSLSPFCHIFVAVVASLSLLSPLSPFCHKFQNLSGFLSPSVTTFKICHRLKVATNLKLVTTATK